MAQDGNSGKDITAAGSSHAELERQVPTGTAVIAADAFENPGFPPHRHRVTDENPKREKSAERTVYTLFYLSIVGSIWAIVAYMLFPIESNNVGDVRLNNMFIGLGIALALLAIGFGAVHWGKSLMYDVEQVDERHPIRGTDEARAGAIQVFQDSDRESGFNRRTLIRNSLIGALVVFPFPPSSSSEVSPLRTRTPSSCSATRCGSAAPAWPSTLPAFPSRRPTSRSEARSTSFRRALPTSGTATATSRRRPRPPSSS